MKTKLNEIKTAAELITFVSAFGIPTDQESICTMQDIIGHTGQDELVRLATDDGTERRDGETWSTGRRGTKATTMNLLFHIWHWEDATQFYNNYVNPIQKKMKEEIETGRKEKAKNEHLKAELEDVRNRLNQTTETGKKILSEKIVAEKELEKAQAEILRLKAMLFDYMTK